MIDQQRLISFLSATPAQPATAFWRSIEVGAIARHGLPPGLGLDLGCGDGTVTAALLLEAGPRDMVGVDLDSSEVAAASRFSFYERLHVCPGSRIPEASGVFDFILANSVLEHIADLDSTMAEVARLLRHHGRLILTAPSPAFHLNLSGSIFPGISRAAYLARLDRRLAHLRYLSEGEWAALCARHGMSVVGRSDFVTRQETQRWETLSRFTSGLLHGASFGTKSPLAIQRLLGLSRLQRRASLPHPLAAVIGRILSAGLESAQRSPAPDQLGSCLLIEATKGR